MGVKCIETNNPECSWVIEGCSSVRRKKINVLLHKLEIVGFKIVSAFCSSKKKDGKIHIGFLAYTYGGNPRAVMDYIQKNRREKYTCYWVSTSKSEYEELKKTGVPVLYKFSLKNAGVFKRMDVWVVDSLGPYTIPATTRRKRQKVIQTWHGVGSKGIFLRYSDIDIWCCASEYTKKNHIKVFNAPPEKLVVTGYPRLDTLKRWSSLPSDEIKKELKIPTGKKTILFAPTFDTGIWPAVWGFGSFRRFLDFINNNNIILIIRSHHYSTKNDSFFEATEKYNNVFWRDMKVEPETAKVLAVADILVTDWSSLYSEYLMLKRPIVFMDLCEREFTNKYGEGMHLVDPSIRPGFKAGTPEELISYLEAALKGNPHAEEQEKAFKLLHGGWDGNSSAKVLQEIERLLER